MDCLNILMVGSALSVRGGMTTVVESFLRNKFDRNIRIIYVPTHIESHLVIKMLYFSLALIKIIYVLMFKRISIVHIHLSEKGSFLRKYIIFNLSRIFKEKIVIHMHGAEFKEFYSEGNKNQKNRIKKMLKTSAVVLVLGESWNKFVKEIDNSINTYILRNSVRYPNEKVKFDGKNINILFLAVVIKRKGIFDLIKAAKLIEDDDELKHFNIKFIIAGSGAEENIVKKDVEKLNLKKYFCFKGWVDKNEKKALLNSSQLFVLPSYNEGLPVAILEAMSYGLPIISTNVGSISDAVKNNFNGFVIEPGDIETLSKKIKKCILDRSLYDKFSTNSKELVKNYYNEKKYFKEVEELYSKISM